MPTKFRRVAVLAGAEHMFDEKQETIPGATIGPEEIGSTTLAAANEGTPTISPELLGPESALDPDIP